jgi:hypothetical protein
MGICGESRGIDVRTVDMYSRINHDEKVYLRSIYSPERCGMPITYTNRHTKNSQIPTI